MNPSILINIAKTGLFAALLTPFVVNLDIYFPFVGPKGLYFMACAQLAFFSWLVLAGHWKAYRPNFKNPVIVAVLAYSGILFLSAVFGADFSGSFWSTFERMGGVLIFCHLAGFMLAAVSILEARDWRRLFFASIIIAAVVGLRALFDQSAAARGGGFLGNDSFLGTYLLFNVFIALYLFLSEKRAGGRTQKTIAGAMFAALSFCLVIQGTGLWGSAISGHFVWPENILKDVFGSGARAAKISFFGGMALAGFLFPAFSKNGLIKKISRAAAILFLAAGLAVSFVAFQNRDAAKRIFIDNFGQSTINSRLVVWEIAWRGFLERPLLGWGPENFGLVFARHYNPCLGSPECGAEIWYDRAHNIVFDILAETGILGIAAYLAIFAAALFVLWKNHGARENGLAAAAIFSALFAAYFVQNLTVFDMATSYLMWFACLGFAASIYDAGRKKETAWPKPLEWPRIAIPAAAGIVSLSMFVLGPMTAGYNTVKAASAPFGSPQRIRLYRDALEASPLGKYQVRLFFANQWDRAVDNPEIADKITKKQAEEIFTVLAGELEKSGRESPLDFRSRLELGRLYGNWSLIDKSKIALAESALEQARSLSPANQQVYLEQAQIKLNQSRIGDAAQLIRQAYDLYRGNPQSESALEQIKSIQLQAATGTKE